MAEENQDGKLTPEELAAIEPLRKLAAKAVKEDAEVEEYVNAASSSSARARGVIILLIIATVFLAVEVRNTFHSWHDARLELRKAVLTFFDREQAPQKLAVMAKKNPDLYRRAANYIRERGLNPRSTLDRELLTKEYDYYREAAIKEISYVHIPFVGVIFDGNDLALFAGLTFTVLLVWLRFSLSSERNNIVLLFSRMNGEDLKRCYDLVAMQQVLTVPRLPGAHGRHRWRGIPKLLYVLPPLVYSLQVIFELRPSSVWDAGKNLGMGKAWFLVVSGLIFVVIILVLSAGCIRILFDIDDEWDRAAARAYPDDFKYPPPPGWLGRRWGAVRSFFSGFKKGMAAGEEAPPGKGTEPGSAPAKPAAPPAPKADNKPAG